MVGHDSVKTFATAPRPEARRPVPCALCGGSSFRPLWNCGTFSFATCRRCGLVQQNPQPEEEAVQARYDAAYLEYEAENQMIYRDLELKAFEDLRLGAYASPLFERASARKARPRVLDVGCATGALLDALRDRGWEPQGVELCAPAAEYGRSRFHLPIHTGTLEAASFPDAGFDLVHASHLIEHLNRPGIFLDELSRILAPGGLVILTTPNVDGMQARIFHGEWRSAIYDHLYLFSRRSLEALLRAHGFRPLRSVTWGGWARGLRPAFLKAPLDRWAKRLGFGDV
ncbi:MAG TPA: class I SAM-dependent methyltransferase, partial [Rectinemataceae bacterium]|nr:class I SAM-dependent methyltransferase [Rectinemataceae bacterium]